MILDYEVTPPADDERNFVLDSFMRNTSWNRRDIEAALDERVLVARSGVVLLGWLCWSGDEVLMAYVKSAYRHLGVARELWLRAGMPSELRWTRGNKVLELRGPPARVGYRVLKALKEQEK